MILLLLLLLHHALYTLHSGLEAVINARMTKASIGFGAHMRSNLEDQKVQASHFRDVEPRDLVKYGESTH
jgi:ATP-dependent protease Clp ATPase subunit